MQVSFQQWGNPHSQQQILMIHGWGMNSGVWSDSAARLERAYPEHLIRAVDLPGYGYSAGYELDHYTAHALAGSLLPLLEDKHTTIIAWSMGGLVALDLLCEPNVVIERLILVSSTPRFVQANDWSNAVEAQVFESFCQSLSEDHEATLERFLAIQALGSRTAREDIKTLQRQLFKRGKPDLIALKKGLELLLNEDKRAQLSGSTEVPIHLIVGKLDTLVKYKGQQLLAQQDNISLSVIPAAGHAPFISHPEEFNQILQNII
jgi:pimeloyl-[acyl-carrier protein] methyl ester esterase